MTAHPAHSPHRFDPDDFLRVAERLLTERDEASARGAASLAARSAFLAVRARCALQGSSGATPAQVQAHLIAQGQHWLALNLQRLQACGHLAEQQIHQRFQPRRARWATETARDIHGWLRSLSAADPSTWTRPRRRVRP